MSSSSKKNLTTLAIDKSLRDELESLKYELRVKDFNTLIKKLVEIYREHKKVKVEFVIRDTLCNKYRESKASLIGWIKLITKELSHLEVNGKDVTAMMLEYLRVDGSEYVVNIEKCVSSNSNSGW